MRTDVGCEPALRRCQHILNFFDFRMMEALQNLDKPVPQYNSVNEFWKLFWSQWVDVFTVI